MCFDNVRLSKTFPFEKKKKKKKMNKTQVCKDFIGCRNILGLAPKLTDYHCKGKIGFQNGRFSETFRYEDFFFLFYSDFNQYRSTESAENILLDHFIFIWKEYNLIWFVRLSNFKKQLDSICAFQTLVLIQGILHITKTCLFKYTEIFTTIKMKIFR